MYRKNAYDEVLPLLFSYVKAWILRILRSLGLDDGQLSRPAPKSASG
ncbi:hypothetical protein PAV_109p00490 (plasmid) [Paenibacillus alvei DSM 29]|nr:hypothetical protein PAV_109p00490 [Paenibacillus alvei DSM 29]